jgi:hypothetical protein
VLGKSSIAVRNVGISHSMGSTDSMPWTKWKGVKPVVVLTTVRYAHKDEKII